MSVFITELKKLLIIAKSDPKSIVGGIIAPSIILIVFVLLFGNLSSIPLVIINKDSGNYGQLLKEDIYSTISPLENKAYFSELVKNEKDAINNFESGKLAGLVIIPEGFSQSIVEKTKPNISFYLNNYHTDFAKNMRLYLQEGIHLFYAKNYDVDIKIEKSSEFEQVGWADIIATGTLLLAFIIGGMFNYLYLFYKERQYGTQVLYKTAANNVLPGFLSRIVVALISSLLAGLFNALLIYLLLGFNTFMYLPALSLSILLTALIYISLAAVMSIYIDNYYTAAMAAMGGAVMLWFFSGGFSAVVPMKTVLLVIHRIVPNSYALDIVRGKYFGQMNLPYVSDLLVLIVMAVVGLVFASYVYRGKLWKG